VKKFKRINITEDKDLKRVQDNAAVCFDNIIDHPFINGAVLTNVALVANKYGGAYDNPIAHGLGKALSGWIITEINKSARIWQSATINQTPELYLLLNTTLDCTVNIFVF